MCATANQFEDNQQKKKQIWKIVEIFFLIFQKDGTFCTVFFKKMALFVQYFPKRWHFLYSILFPENSSTCFTRKMDSRCND
jgi:hypothetical protein